MRGEMREIKFRAWRDNNWLLKSNGSNVYELSDMEEGYFTKEVQWMQYTGLVDKNGKEIYEGDICKAPHDFGPGGWHERTFEVKYHNEHGYQWNYWDLSKIEIIGNIYEQGHLLNDKTN